MERVQESTDEFGEIREIIGRYDTLVATHLVISDVFKKFTKHLPLLSDFFNTKN